MPINVFGGLLYTVGMLKSMVYRTLVIFLLMSAILSPTLADTVLAKRIDYSLTAVVGPLSEGFGVIHGPLGATVSDPVEPNASGVLGIGIDTSNPRPFGSMREVWFGPAGNIDDRPQREISIHWNGREIANRFCDEEIGRAHV